MDFIHTMLLYIEPALVATPQTLLMASDSITKAGWDEQFGIPVANISNSTTYTQK